MDFSEAYKSSGAAPLFSPDGKYIATVIDYRLVIRAADSMNVVQLYSCLDKIHKIEWSPNSVYVLCGLYDRAVVQVRHLRQAASYSTRCKCSLEEA